MSNLPRRPSAPAVEEDSEGEESDADSGSESDAEGENEDGLNPVIERKLLAYIDKLVQKRSSDGPQGTLSGLDFCFDLDPHF